MNCHNIVERAVSTPHELAKIMVPTCSFMKREYRGAQWIYHDTIHNRCREMGLGTLKDVSL